MTRIIAGHAKGRRIAVPSRGTRPTSDRVREAIFSAVDAFMLRQDRSWPEIVVADLYAGSGALGFEAWSRGAAAVTLVESAKDACRILYQNRDALQASTVRIECTDVVAWVERTAVPLDVCFLDPPYRVADADLQDLISSLHGRGMLNPDALVVVERAASPATSPFGPEFSEVRERSYGDTRVWYGHFPIESSAEGS
jgi:16S rRNA (guanine966-N2)-methyltransferase